MQRAEPRRNIFTVIFTLFLLPREKFPPSWDVIFHAHSHSSTHTQTRALANHLTTLPEVTHLWWILLFFRDVTETTAAAALGEAQRAMNFHDFSELLLLHSFDALLTRGTLYFIRWL